MKILKLVVLSFLVFAFIITIISLFIPSDVEISKAIRINAPKDSLMNQIAEPVNWKNWYPSSDSLQPHYEEGKIRGVVLDKSSKQFLLIDYIRENEVAASYQKEGKTLPTGWLILDDSGGAVTIKWYMKFHLGWYPWKKFSSLLFEKRYGPSLEQGLNNLKTWLESNHSSNK
jgi:hypothetical protein